MRRKRRPVEESQTDLSFLPTRTRLTVLWLLAWFAMGPVASVAQESEALFKRPPNFVIILADDLGYGDLSCYGNQRFTTPRLDRLAAGGMRWTDFHANGNVCSPTRAALLTGEYQQRWGIDGVITALKHRDQGLPTAAVVLPEYLKPRGYVTALFGKWHLGYAPRFHPLQQGFDEFVGFVSGNVDYFSHLDQTGQPDWYHGTRLVDEPGYTTSLITQHAVEFLRKQHEQTFCLYIAHEAPHYPYQSLRDGPERFPGQPFEIQGSRKDRSAAYAEMMAELDRGVGTILDTLTELNLADDTFVLFLSDNGANSVGNNGPLRGFKGSDWEGGHRVPFLAWNPVSIPAGSECHQLAATFDLLPTMLELSGGIIPPDTSFDGVSLVRFLRDPHTEPLSRTLIWNGNAVRRDRWKLIRQQRDQRQPALYNLNDDLAEQHNLAVEHPEIVTALEQELDSWQKHMAASREQRRLTPLTR